METFQPSLWQLRVFEAVARLESVSLAAQEVLRSQPAVTAQIMRIEQALRTKLFDRTATGMYPTPAGIFVLVRCREILAEADQAIARIGAHVTAAPLVRATVITRSQMQALIAVEQTHSFISAAARLKISQATLQRSARQLESNMGIQLFQRTAQGIATTAAGTELARAMGIVNARIEALMTDIDDRHMPVEECITVGVQLLEPHFILCKAILEIEAKLGDVKIRVITDRLGPLFQRLRTGAIDFILGALSGADYGPDIVEQPICLEDYAIVARRGHVLAVCSEVSKNQLRQYDWVLPPRGSRRHVIFEQIFADGQAPKATIETHSLSAVRMILAESDMLTVLSRFEVMGEQKAGLLSEINFKVRGPGRVFGIIKTAGWQPTPAQAAFVEALQRTAKQLA